VTVYASVGHMSYMMQADIPSRLASEDNSVAKILDSNSRPRISSAKAPDRSRGKRAATTLEPLANPKSLDVADDIRRIITPKKLQKNMETLLPSSPLTPLSDSSPPLSTLPFASSLPDDSVPLPISASPAPVSPITAKKPRPRPRPRYRIPEQASCSQERPTNRSDLEQMLMTPLPTELPAGTGIRLQTPESEQEQINMGPPAAPDIQERSTSPIQEEPEDGHANHATRLQPTEMLLSSTIIPTSQIYEASISAARPPQRRRRFHTSDTQSTASTIVPSSQTQERSMKVPSPVHHSKKGLKGSAVPVMVASHKATTDSGEPEKVVLSRDFRYNPARQSASPAYIPSSQTDEYGAPLPSFATYVIRNAATSDRTSRRLTPSPSKTNAPSPVPSSQRGEGAPLIESLRLRDDAEEDEEAQGQTQWVPTSQTQFEQDIHIEDGKFDAFGKRRV
jgi:hypothetical protein